MRFTGSIRLLKVNYGFFFLGEIPTVLSITGLILVLVALAMLVFFDKNRKQRRKNDGFFE